LRIGDLSGSRHRALALASALVGLLKSDRLLEKKIEEIDPRTLFVSGT
jgi:hypothetical protein